MRLKTEYSLRDLGFEWWLRNTWGFNWLWQIIDAYKGAKWHDGKVSTFWWYLKSNFRNRWPYS